jgi:short-subunit dehydrogenase
MSILKETGKLLFFPCLGYSRYTLRQRLAGKIVLITGASYGIGECLADALAETDAHLLLVARTAERLEEAKRRVEARGGRADVLPCDLREDAEVRDLSVQILRLAGGVDIVVSNAGKSIRRSIFDSLDRFHDVTRTMGVNYLGPVRLLLPLLPGLVARRGHVINISAVNVLLAPVPKWAAYQASKAAFDQWFRSVGPELNARGVGTTSVYLPLVRTRMIEPTESYKRMPAMRPEQVAGLVCRAIITRRHVYAPWWLVWGQLASVLFRRPWEAQMIRHSRRP